MAFIDAFTKQLDPDRALQVATRRLIDASGLRYALGKQGTAWSPGEPLRLLFAGYVGTRNTGADVRVEEMIRQLRHVLGDDNVVMTIMTNDPALTAGYFQTVRQVQLPAVFPPFLYTECTQHHGVVACEGSMFKSKFAEALSTMMAGALGMATVEGKLAVGYGAEAGGMSPALERFVRETCRDALVICRNQPSQRLLEGLGIRTTGGTDTAWTFEPAPPEVGARVLQSYGLDPTRPILAVCPINPFWWPVRPDLVRAAAHKLTGEFAASHYRSVYFHEDSLEQADSYKAYIEGLATATRAFVQETGTQVVAIGMEQLDRSACEDFARALDSEIPVIVSDRHDMYTLVSALRRCSMLLSSRFHAIVTSMPATVASAGVTMDERIRNLMTERGHLDLVVEVDDEDLADSTLTMLRRLWTDRDRVIAETHAVLPAQLQRLGEMGIAFADEVARIYPSFPLPDRPRSWERFLPPLSPTVTRALLGDSGAPPTPHQMSTYDLSEHRI